MTFRILAANFTEYFGFSYSYTEILLNVFLSG